MHTFIHVIAGLLILFAHDSFASERDKQASVNELMEILDTKQATTLMANAFTYQMLQSLSKQYGKLDQVVADLIQDEAKIVMYEEFILNNKLNDILYSLYDEYFTEEQLRELVEFYKTPAGKISLSAAAAISSRSMTAAKQHAASISPKLQKRIEDKLRAASKLAK